MMVLGPVFHFELIRIARRWQLYVIRFAFGAFLLLAVCFNYLSFFDPDDPWRILDPAPVSLNRLATFGQALFTTLMASQAGLVLALTPGIVADAISGERQRKTLHYLMASRVRSVEIVLGKLAARMLHVAVFVAVVLPILSLLTLVGGIDPALVFWGYLGTMSTAYLLAAIGILASTLLRTARESFLASYLISGLFLVVPMIVRAFGAPRPGWWSPIYDLVLEANEWLRAAGPFVLAEPTTILRTFNSGPGAILDQIALMAALQVAYGTVLIVAATLLVRPAYRWIEGRSGVDRRGRRRGRFRLWPRPAVGEWPIYWKEAHFAGTRRGVFRGFVRLTLGLLVLFIVGSVLYQAPAAFGELLEEGPFATDWSSYGHRSEFNYAIRTGIAALFTLALLVMGVTSGASLASEREQDTWISLISTPLDGVEILREKMLAALRSARSILGLIGVIAMIGVFCGAIHPLGIVLGFLALALFSWFIIALGTFLSLISPTAWRAQAGVLASVANPLACCGLPAPSPLIWMSWMSYPQVDAFLSIKLGDLPLNSYEIIPLLMALGYTVGGPVLYFFAAYFLTKGAFDRFDHEAGRPTDPRGRLSPHPVQGKPIEKTTGADPLA